MRKLLLLLLAATATSFIWANDDGTGNDNGNGTFIPGWYSYESPDRVSANSNHYQSFHMNWGWRGNENGWFLFESTGTSKGDFKHNRKDYIISVAN